ncbi:hypothetical protein [Streptomyces sp. NPDC001833]|uniref:hypothetical protein n=1 Tax=Streptomyces sp. NPDC001833 TaxID=3154658 RepID=UPI003323C59C
MSHQQGGRRAPAAGLAVLHHLLHLRLEHGAGLLGDGPLPLELELAPRGDDDPDGGRWWRGRSACRAGWSQHHSTNATSVPDRPAAGGSSASAQNLSQMRQSAA